MVELGTALFFAAVAWWISTAGITGTAALVPTLAAFLYLSAVSVALAVIDLETHTLPNRIVLAAYVVGPVLLTLGAVVNNQPGRLLSAVSGGVLLFGLYLLMALAYPGGMGFGDVKLAGVLGLYLGWLGWGSLVVGAFSAFLLGGLFSLVLIWTKKANRKSGIPFGPWMLAGAWLGIFGGEAIADGYLSWFGLT